MLALCLLAMAGDPGSRPASQKYAQYVDAETAVVKKPEGWDDPFGDGVWRSSWFYASLLVIKAKDPATYAKLKADHGVDEALAAKFLTYFRDHCAARDGWSLPKNPSQKFSGDQLAPLLYSMACTHAYGPAPREGCSQGHPPEAGGA